MSGMLNISGILRVGEFTLSLIAWACVVSFKEYNQSTNLVYGVTVLILFWLLDLAWIVLFATGYHQKINLDQGKWGALNFGISSAGAFLIFIASCTIAADSSSVGVLQAGAAFSFFCCFNWVGSCVFAWREMRGGFCWESSAVEG